MKGRAVILPEGRAEFGIQTAEGDSLQPPPVLADQTATQLVVPGDGDAGKPDAGNNELRLRISKAERPYLFQRRSQFQRSPRRSQRRVEAKAGDKLGLGDAVGDAPAEKAPEFLQTVDVDGEAGGHGVTSSLDQQPHL